MNPDEPQAPADTRAELITDTIVDIAKQFNQAANLSAEKRPEMLRTVSSVLKAYDAIMPMVVSDVLMMAQLLKESPKQSAEPADPFGDGIPALFKK